MAVRLLYNDLGELVTHGHIANTRRGNIHQHLRLPNGHFRYHQLTDTDRLTAVELPIATLPPATYAAEIHAYGERRMQLALQVNANGHLSILSATAFPHNHDHATRPQFPDDAIPVAEPGDAAKVPDQPHSPGISPEEWATLDLPAKWKAFEADLAKHRFGQANHSWATFLRAQKDEAFLEEIAIYRHHAFEEFGAGTSLKALNSDRWIRICAWHHQAGAGHGMSIAQTLLSDTNSAPEVLAWFETYPKAATPVMNIDIVDNLRKHGYKAAEKTTGLPPLDPNAIYAPWLEDAPAPIPSQREYDRALDAFTARGQFNHPYFKRFRDRVQGPSENLLQWQSAILACSYLPGNRVPVSELTTILEDRSLDHRIREAAVLGFKSGPAYSRFFIMHDIGLDPEDPAWPAAITLLGDFGDDFTLEQLKHLKHLKLPPESAPLLNTARQSISARLAGQANPEKDANQLRDLYARTLGAHHRKSGYAADLRTHFLGLLQETSPKMRRDMLKIFEDMKPNTLAKEKLLAEIRNLQ